VLHLVVLSALEMALVQIQELDQELAQELGQDLD
jgi:hypothetical protein